VYELVLDAMLGKEARWLRVLGVSVYYSPSASDKELLELAKRFNAVLVTRDRQLYLTAKAKGVKALLIEREGVNAFLKSVSRRLGIRLEIDLNSTRCPLCNAKLRRATKLEVSARVPREVLERYEVFLVCPSCGHVYWPGTHLARMREILRRIREGSEVEAK